MRRLWLMLAAVFALTACGSDAGPLAEEDLVYCLGSDREQAMADAAVALRLVERPKLGGAKVLLGEDSVSVEEWRGRAPEDFARACQTLRATVEPESSPVATVLLGAACVAGGVVLGLLGALLFRRRSA